jgi:secondary thiamine-phosphate synthase enzyme
MRQALHRLAVKTENKSFVEITAEVAQWVSAQAMTTGLLTLFCQHTSASLLIQENADPDVRKDLEDFFARLAPEGRGLYVHENEGPDDMPAHIRSALTQTQISIPLDAGRMVLGTWQGIYLFEHRSGAHRREIVLSLMGE